MNPIRQCIRINDDMEVERVMTQEAFWNSAVRNAHEIFAPGSVSHHLHDIAYAAADVISTGYTASFPGLPEGYECRGGCARP